MTRISKISLASIITTWAFMAFYIAVILASLLSDNPTTSIQTSITTGFHVSYDAGYPVPTQSIPFGSASWIVFVLGTMVAAAPTLLCLAILLRILGDYNGGDIFTLANARRYRNIGIILVIDALAATTIGDSIRDLAAILNNPPGERILSISVGSTNFYLLFFGVIMFTIALVMQEASKINSENQLTV